LRALLLPQPGPQGPRRRADAASAALEPGPKG
jgi:hypothetical protein